ncbi:MAG: FAD-dependent oxidoreductase, partial [Actinomycetota bacterium]
RPEPVTTNDSANQPLRIRIIGAVAAGTTAATKARRNAPDADIVLYERDEDISYVGCGIPYFVGGELEDVETLRPRGPEWFAEKYAIDVRTRNEVTTADPDTNTLTIHDLDTGQESSDSWDVLILATGASAVIPPIDGVGTPGVFPVRSIQDAEAIDAWISDREPRNAVVVGSGFIGLEMAEQLVHRGLGVTIVEMLPQVMPAALDGDMADPVAEELRRHGVELHLGRSVDAIEGDDAATAVVLDGGERLPADLVIMSVGVRPNVALAKQLGVELGETGAIAVDRQMRTSVPGILATGDVVENLSVITDGPIWRPLGSTANKTGRVAGDVATGGAAEHRGVLGTGILRVFDLGVAHTGLTEAEARKQGYDVVTHTDTKHTRAGYLGGRQVTIKAVADRATGRILGAQVVGPEGVDKRVDVLATAITFGATAEDLIHLDLAYSPPFSTAKDPVHFVGMVLASKIAKSRGD